MTKPVIGVESSGISWRSVSSHSQKRRWPSHEPDTSTSDNGGDAREVSQHGPPHGATPCAKGSFQAETGQHECAECPAGMYQDEEAQTACQICIPGYYCPEGSTHGRQHECGEGHYCPPGSASPLAVAAGLYGVGGGSSATRTGQAACPTCCPEGVPECSAPREELYETFY